MPDAGQRMALWGGGSLVIGATTPSPRPRPTLNQAATTCQIKGEIVFLNKDTYENKGALIAYKNVDDVIRQIYWKADPNDGALTIGPNLFEDLTLASRFLLLTLLQHRSHKKQLS